MSQPMSDRVILSTAPLPGPGLDALRELGEAVLDPWIDHRPLRLLDAEALARRATELGATVLICEADQCAGPVLDLPLEAIGSTRGDPTNVDLDAAWRFEGLGMRVIASDPFVDDATHGLDDLVAEADVVTAHATLTPDTVGWSPESAPRA